MNSKSSNIRLSESILDLSQSNEFLRIKNFYQRKSYWEILGISRQENVHSKFLAWLFNPSESHLAKNFCLEKLFESLLKVLNKTNQPRPSWLSQELERAIICNDYRLADVNVVTEKSIDGKKRIDIWITFQISIQGNEFVPMQIVIENKVKSSEHDKQTVFYRNWAQQQRDKGQAICIYLTPLSMSQLITLYQDSSNNKLKPADKEFIHINYQTIMDSMLQPLFEYMNDGAEKERLKDYMRSLSFSAINHNNDDKNKDDLLMAISADEKKLVSDFWEKYNDVLSASFAVLAEDETTDDEDRKTLANMAKKLSERDYTKYNVFYGDQKLNSAPAVKRNVLLLIVEKAYELDSKDQIIDFIINQLSREIKNVILSVDRIADNSRYHQKTFEYKEKNYKISNQWGKDNLPILLKNIEEASCFKGFRVSTVD